MATTHLTTKHNGKNYTVSFNRWAHPYRILVYASGGIGRLGTWREVWPKRGSIWVLSPAMTAIAESAKERLLASSPSWPLMLSLPD